MTDNVVKIPEYYERPRRMFGVWTLRKNTGKAISELWTHPIGGDEVSGELLRSEAGRHGLALIDLATSWREQFLAKGCTA